MKFALISCVAVAVVGLAQADTFYYKGPGADPANKSSFSGTGVGWKSAAGEEHATPQPGHSYVIDGEKHEPRSYGTVTFNGDALYLNNRDIAFFGGMFTCTNLIAGGAGAFMQTSSGNSGQTLRGKITVLSGKILAFWLVSGGALEIASDIVGDGTCYLRGQTANAGMKLNFAGDNSGFAGRFSDTNTSDYKGGQCLRFISTSSWFGNPAAFDAESVRLTNATRVEFAVSQELETPNRGIWIDGGSEVNVYAGCTAGIGAPIKSQNGFAKDGAGTLILRTPSPELAGTVMVQGGTLGGGCRDAFGAAQLSMADGTTLLFCSTNGPLVLAAAPVGTYVLSVNLKLLVEGSNDLLDLPESSPADLSKITFSLPGGELSARVETGRQIVSVLIPAGSLEDMTTFYLRGNDAQGCSSFDGTGAGWTNVLGEVHLSPQSGYDYVIDGWEPRTKRSGNTVFSGDALYLSGKDLALCSLDGGAFVCDNLVCNGAGDVLASAPGTLKGRVTVTEGARLGLYPLNGELRVESAISGTGTLLLKGGSTSRLVGDNSQFFGRCAATGANAMSIESPSAWFGNPPEFDPDSLGWTNAMSVTFNSSLDANTPNRGVRLNAKSNNDRTVIAVAADKTVTLGLALLAPQGFKKGGAGVLKLAPLSGSQISGNVTAMAGLLGGTCSNAFGGAQLVLDPGANLLFCSTNGPYALAAAPTGTYAIEVEGFGYPTPFTPHVKIDLLRLPPGAAFDASKVTVRRVQPVRNELSAELVVRRTEAEVRVSAVFRRKVGTILMVK